MRDELRGWLGVGRRLDDLVDEPLLRQKAQILRRLVAALGDERAERGDAASLVVDDDDLVAARHGTPPGLRDDDGRTHVRRAQQAR